MNIQASALTLTGGLTRDYLLHHRVCPKAIADDGSLVIAVTDGSLLAGADDIAFAYRRDATFETVAHEELERLVERLTTRSERTIELARRGSVKRRPHYGRSRSSEPAAGHSLRQPAGARRI
jgi:hypothetical protein